MDGEESFELEEPSLHYVVVGFYHAVQWSEWWIVTLLCTHVVLLALSLGTRKWFSAQVTLWLLLMVATFCTEYINTWARANWQLFATQNYFDAEGFFAVVVYAAPLLLCQLIIVVQTLVSVSSLLITVKRAELRQKSREQEKEQKEPKKQK